MATGGNGKARSTVTYLNVTDCVEVLFIKTVNKHYCDFITFQ